MKRLLLREWAFGCVLDFQGGIVSLLVLEWEWVWPWRDQAEWGWPWRGR